MSVESIVRGGRIQNSGTEAGQIGLHDVPHILADYAFGVSHRRLVLPRSRGQNVGPPQRVDASGADIIQRVPAANGRTIHLRKDFQGLASLVLALNAGQETVRLQIAHRRNRHTGFRQSPGQTAPKVDTSQYVLRFRVDLLDDSAQPAVDADLFRFAGVPDVHGAEVRIAGVRVSNTQKDGQLARVPERLQGRHGWMEAQLVVQEDDLVLWNAQARPVIPV